MLLCSHSHTVQAAQLRQGLLVVHSFWASPSQLYPLYPLLPLLSQRLLQEAPAWDQAGVHSFRPARPLRERLERTVFLQWFW